MFLTMILPEVGGDLGERHPDHPSRPAGAAGTSAMTELS